MHAAAAALGAYRHGGGVLLSLALRDVAAHALAFGSTTRSLGSIPEPADIRPSADADGARAWEVVAAGERQPVLPPRARPSHGTARPLGADTDALLRELHVG
jgi:hypothetical protein